MVIQRIQSLFLLLASIIMAVLTFFVPIATAQTTEGSLSVMMIDYLPLFVLNALITLLLFVDIFLFKNLPLQIKVIRISVVLTIVSALIFAFYFIFQQPIGMQPCIVWPSILYVLSLIFAFLALRGCRKDHKLLTSYDRLR